MTTEEIHRLRTSFALLVLARQRPDSIVLRGDVVRVASYYLNQWTGEASLPDDPPPR